MLQGIISGETPQARAALASVPRALDAICARAMARAQTDRYATARELATDIQLWLADEPVSAYRDGLAARISRWCRRRLS
jgi:ABC-type phosphate/phosphonate transport system ATPase subunit